jgi:hypothetical protein
VLELRMTTELLEVREMVKLLSKIRIYELKILLENGFRV